MDTRVLSWCKHHQRGDGGDGGGQWEKMTVREEYLSITEELYGFEQQEKRI